MMCLKPVSSPQPVLAARLTMLLLIMCLARPVCAMPESGPSVSLVDRSEEIIYAPSLRAGRCDDPVPALNPADDTLTVTQSSVIVVGPSPVQVAFMKKKLGMDYATVADDNSYYIMKLMDFCNDHGIEAVGTEAGRLVFPDIGISLNTGKYLDCSWFVIAYKAGQMPLLIGVDEQESRILDYFGK